MCPQQYFCEYVLGWRGKGGLKADKGTIVHKILEIMCLAKKAEQDGLSSFVDDVIGEVITNGKKKTSKTAQNGFTRP